MPSKNANKREYTPLVIPVKRSREFAPVASMASLDNFAGITRGDANAIDS